MKTRTVLIGLAALAIAGGLTWRYGPALVSGRSHSPPSPPAIPVTAGVADTRDVPVYVQGLGTVQAFNTVNVRSRVDGQITKVFFKEGQDVKTSDPLFQIDPRPFQAALDQAKANKAKDEAALQGAQLDLQRYSTLLPSGFQTRQQYDQQKATVGQFQGAVQADQAQIDTAQLNLDYATVRSLIDELQALSTKPPGDAQFTEASMRFHEALIKSAHNRALAAHFKALRSVLEPIYARRESDAVARRVIVSHEQIVDSIEANDTERATNLMRRRLETIRAHQLLKTVES